eukprot:SAG31_NODE_10707_length_1108_cov_0.990089_2_plen_106_part_00
MRFPLSTYNAMSKIYFGRREDYFHSMKISDSATVVAGDRFTQANSETCFVSRLTCAGVATRLSIYEVEKCVPAGVRFAAVHRRLQSRGGCVRFCGVCSHGFVSLS